MRPALAIVPLLSLILGACATMARDEARQQAIAECAGMGLRYYETASSAREGLIVATGSVTGLCVGSDDPRWEQAVSGAAG